MSLIRRTAGRRAVPPVAYHLSAVKFDRFEQQHKQHFGFHFGTKDTALRVGDKLRREGRVQPGDTVYLYTVKLYSRRSLVLKEERGGAWNPVQIFRGIFDRDELPDGFTEDERHAFYEDEVIAPSGENLQDLYYDPWVQADEFASWFHAHGYDAIEYENIFEGGGTSYIVFRPEQIEILDVEPWRLP
ncbi:MAG TPA: hypothetical protein EYF98_10850 [Planctomycetes bacterium]|nr:hypothetical protein [Planctomycetota bacterium]